MLQFFFDYQPGFGNQDFSMAPQVIGLPEIIFKMINDHYRVKTK
jgi:hypothetical protein